jgi:glutamate carboxypeptidase
VHARARGSCIITLCAPPAAPPPRSPPSSRRAAPPRRAPPPRPRPAATPATAPATAGAPAGAALSADEARLRTAVAAHYEAAVALLARAVDIPSGTHNLAGVRRVGDLFAGELQALGFRTRWVDAPASMRRAGHLVAEHPGQGARLLLIGHLDTVFEGDDQKWVRQDTIARGAGTGDMKGGDVAMVLALRALKDAGLLERMHVTVIMTGDEEAPGAPIEQSRVPLTDLARASDVALAFEGGSRSQISVTRRGSSSWTLEVKARQAHSAGVFSDGAGYGAIYEGARVIDEFRRTLAGQPGLTFNVGLVGGGTAAAVDTSLTRISAEGKTNIIAPALIARGDLRFLREAQKDSARAVMRADRRPPARRRDQHHRLQRRLPRHAGHRRRRAPRRRVRRRQPRARLRPRAGAGRQQPRRRRRVVRRAVHPRHGRPRGERARVALAAGVGLAPVAAHGRRAGRRADVAPVARVAARRRRLLTPEDPPCRSRSPRRTRR